MDLKPCPFCGGAASIDADTPYTGATAIGCTICYATTYQPLGSRDTLINIWNGRKPDCDRLAMLAATIKAGVEARGLQDDADIIGSIYRDVCRTI